MQSNSPADASFALDLDSLRAPQITLWSAWRGGDIAGIGALKTLDGKDAGCGELKSMRTAPEHLRQGVAAALLEHIVDQARQRKLTRLSLETGSGPEFAAALALYKGYGFVQGEPFAEYTAGPFNQFFHLALS